VNIQRERAELKVEIEISPCGCCAPRKRQNTEIMQRATTRRAACGTTRITRSMLGGISGISIITPRGSQPPAPNNYCRVVRPQAFSVELRVWTINLGSGLIVELLDARRRRTSRIKQAASPLLICIK
jgi:hypothetical protein